jgi:hypothetical protein
VALGQMLRIVFCVSQFQGCGKMIDRKHQKVVFSFFISLLMSCIMPLVISVYNVGR